MKRLCEHPTIGRYLYLFLICTILVYSVMGIPEAKATVNSYTLSGNQQEDMVTVAEAQMGLKAGDFGFTTEWCAYFVNWVGNKAAPGLFPSSATSLGTGKDIVVWMANRDYAKFYYFEDQAKTSLDNKNAGTPDYSTGNYIKTDADSFTPQRGDIILFHWAGNSAYWDHVALVSGVSGDTVSYIGGNQGSGGSYATRAVTRTSISKTGGEVIGFLRPNYGSTDGTMQSGIIITQGSTAISRPATTYDEVTQIVNSYLSIIGSNAHWNAYHSYGGDDTTRLCKEVDSGDFTSCLTRTACPSLTGSSCYSNAFSGPTMNGGRQCAGFADYMWYIVFNSTAAQAHVNSVSSSYLFMPGDIIRYNISGGQHSVFVYSSDGSNAILIECNYGGHCAIKTRTVSQSTLRNWVNQSGAYMVKSIATFGSGCSHNYITENEYDHPHKEYRKCTKCGEWAYTGNTGYRSDCSECNVHSHNYIIEYEYAHPHKEYRRCSSCGYVEYTGNTTWCDWCSECNPPTPPITDYPVPFKAYPLSTEHYAASAYPSVNDLINGTSFLGYIYGDDLCTIKEVYAGGYCLVNCPWGSGTKDVYTYLGSFLNASYTPRTVTAAATITTYTHASGTTTLGWIDPGDPLVVVDEYGGRTQVIYPHSSDGIYRCGWVDSIPQPDPGTYAVGSPSLCAEHWTVTATSGLRCRTNAGTSYTLNNEYGLAYGVELIIAQKQYDSAGSLWGWGHGYSNTLGTNIGGWFCLDYANYDYSYLPGAPSITAIVAGSTTTPTLIKWNSTDRATCYDIYVDGTMIACSIHGTQYSLNLGAGTHSVYVVAVNKDFAYAYDPYVYYTSGPASSVTIAAAPNPDNYAIRAAQWNGHTYVLYESNLTWQDAKSYCERNGGTLACITSAQEESVIENLNVEGRYLWLGGYWEAGSSTYRWVSGEGFSYTNWASNEPSCTGGIEYYLGTYPQKWNDYRMSSETINGFIMEYPTPSIEYVTSVDWQGHTYTVYHGCVTWEAAETFCEENGGYLAVITSSAEQSMIESLNSSNQNLWLGAEDKDGDGVYRWVTDEAMSYTKWNGGQPDCDRGVEHYLGTWSQNWNDFPNYYPTVYGFVMEKVIPITTYTVKYDAMNGSGAPVAQVIELGVPCTLSCDIPNRSGYIFKGWDISPTAGNAIYQPNDTLFTDSDVTLYAVWDIHADDHNYEMIESVEPTCTTDGYNNYICKYCGDEMHEIVSATGHDYQLVDRVDPTCYYEGWALFECTVCKDVYRDPIAVLDHTPVTDAAVPATCTTDGLTEGSHCSVCDAVIVAQTSIPAKGHTPVTDAAVPATCTTDGLTEGSHCSVCGATIVAQTTVKAKGHTPVTDAAVPATCTTDGLTEGSHCSVCDDAITAQTTVKALGHDSGEWVTVNEATAAEDGSRELQCTRCHAVLDTEVIPKTGSSEPVDTPATKTVTAKPGEQITVKVYVNTKEAVMAKVKVDIDTNVFEYVSANGLNGCTAPTKASGSFLVGDGTQAFGSMEIGTIVLRVKDEVADGKYTIGTSIVEAFTASLGDAECKAAVDIVRVKSGLPGDVNEDNVVNTKDAIILSQYLADWDVTINLENADVNNDNKANLKDLILLKQYLADWDVELI